MLSSISGQFFAGHWNPGISPPPRPPLVTNSLLNYDMNYGSYVPAATSLLPVSSVLTNQLQFSNAGIVTYDGGNPSYILMSTASNNGFASTLLSSDYSLLSTVNFTFCFWVYPTFFGGGDLFNYSAPGNGSLIFRSLDSSLGYQIGFADNSSTSSAFPAPVFNTGQWNLVTIYIKPNQLNVLMEVYSNGVLATSITASSFTNTPPFGNSVGPFTTVNYGINSASNVRQRWSNIQLYLDDTTFTPADHVLKWNSERAYYAR